MTGAPARARRLRWWQLSIPVLGSTVAALVVLLAPVGRSASSGIAPPTFPDLRTDYPPLVFTYFYYWYDLPNGVHSGALANRPAEPDASYRSVDWFSKQLGDMEDAGIDVALAVYWGPAEPSSDIGLDHMARAARELRGHGRMPPRIAMFLDTGTIGGWPDAQRDLTRPENQERVYQLVRQFHSILPRAEWAMLDQRPVIWFWATWVDIIYDQGVIDHVRARFTADFGVAPFIVLERSWRQAVKRDAAGIPRQTEEVVTADEFYEWGAALLGFRAPGGIAQVGPGYDERALPGPGRTGRFRDREDGAFYRRQLERALAAGHRLLAIETWNEFHEATNIADSVEYGRQYIELTREYADRWKARTLILPESSPIPEPDSE